MSGPRYAETCKLMRSLFPYLNSGGASYDACSVPSVQHHRSTPNRF